MEEFKTIDDEIDNFWGGDEDIATEVEFDYEEATGKSAWIWSSYDDPKEEKRDDLDGRPEEFSTHGYTQDFEEWGLNLVEMAIHDGKHDFESILDFVEDNADVLPTED